MTPRGHKNAQRDLTAEYVRNVLRYEKSTGLFFWRVTLSKRAVAGRRAGFVNEGRIKIGIAGREYMAHRLAWLYVTGEWPELEIDHHDRIKSNNKWKNLRPATPSQNHLNKPIQPNNKSGIKGVCWATKQQRWMATAKYKGKHYYFGVFQSREEAAAARKAGVKKLYDELDGAFIH